MNLLFHDMYLSLCHLFLEGLLYPAAGIDVVKVQKLCDITKPWLEKVGALCKKEDVPILTHPLSALRLIFPQS